MEKTAFKRKPVESSNIASIGHSFPRRILEVEFKNGSIYRYKGVNNKTYKTLLSADSKGKTFHNLVRGKYPYKKLVTKDGESVNEPYKEANTMNYEEMVKTAYEEIMGTEKKAATVSDGRIYLDKDEYSLRDLTKSEKIAEGAKNVGRKIGSDAKAVGRHIQENPDTYIPIAVGGALAGGVAAYNAVSDKRRRKRKQAQKVAHAQLDEMTKEAWSISDDPDLAAKLDSVKNTSSDNLPVPINQTPREHKRKANARAYFKNNKHVPESFYKSNIKKILTNLSDEDKKKWQKRGVIGSAALAGTIGTGIIAKKIYDKHKKAKEAEQK